MFNSAGGDVEFDDVAFFQQRERATDKGLGRNVEDAGTVTRAAHSRVGNADHVADAGFEEFLRNLKIAPFGHSGRAFGAGVAQYENAVRVDIESGIVQPGVHFVEAVEDDGAAGVLEKAWFGGGGFNDSAVGSEIAVENRQAAGRKNGIIQTADDIGIVDFRVGNIFAESFAGDGQASQIQMRVRALSAERGNPPA